MAYNLCRVTYDEATWREIATVLRADREMIDPINRAQVLEATVIFVAESKSPIQIICDVLALTESGHLTPGLAEDVLSYLPAEDAFAPLDAAYWCSDNERRAGGRRHRRARA